MPFPIPVDNPVDLNEYFENLNHSRIEYNLPSGVYYPAGSQLVIEFNESGEVGLTLSFTEEDGTVIEVDLQGNAVVDPGGQIILAVNLVNRDSIVPATAEDFTYIRLLRPNNEGVAHAHSFLNLSELQSTYHLIYDAETNSFTLIDDVVVSHGTGEQTSPILNTDAFNIYGGDVSIEDSFPFAYQFINGELFILSETGRENVNFSLLRGNQPGWEDIYLISTRVDGEDRHFLISDHPIVGNNQITFYAPSVAEFLVANHPGKSRVYDPVSGTLLDQIEAESLLGEGEREFRDPNQVFRIIEEDGVVRVLTSLNFSTINNPELTMINAYLRRLALEAEAGNEAAFLIYGEEEYMVKNLQFGEAEYFVLQHSDGNLIHVFTDSDDLELREVDGERIYLLRLPDASRSDEVPQLWVLLSGEQLILYGENDQREFTELGQIDYTVSLGEGQQTIYVGTLNGEPIAFTSNGRQAEILAETDNGPIIHFDIYYYVPDSDGDGFSMYRRLNNPSIPEERTILVRGQSPNETFYDLDNTESMPVISLNFRGVDYRYLMIDREIIAISINQQAPTEITVTDSTLNIKFEIGQSGSSVTYVYSLSDDGAVLDSIEIVFPDGSEEVYAPEDVMTSPAFIIIQNQIYDNDLNPLSAWYDVNDQLFTIYNGDLLSLEGDIITDLSGIQSALDNAGVSIEVIEGSVIIQPIDPGNPTDLAQRLNGDYDRLAQIFSGDETSGSFFIVFVDDTKYVYAADGLLVGSTNTQSDSETFTYAGSTYTIDFKNMEYVQE